jgi:GNAT superfamily N-acetyltransferase
LPHPDSAVIVAADDRFRLAFASTDDDCRQITALLTRMHAEVGRAPKNFGRAVREIDRVVHEECAMIVYDDDEPIGSAGIISYAPWYADEDEHHLTERWFYVLPDYRGTGRPFRLLFDEIGKLCADLGMRAEICIFNPHASRSGMRIRSDRYFVTAAGSVVFAGAEDRLEGTG